jgi:hypothetical protein
MPTIIIRFAGESIRSHAVSMDDIRSRLPIGVSRVVGRRLRRGSFSLLCKGSLPIIVEPFQRPTASAARGPDIGQQQGDTQ